MDSDKEKALQKAFEKVLSCSTGRVRMNRIDELMSRHIPEISTAINKKAFIQQGARACLTNSTIPIFSYLEKNRHFTLRTTCTW